MFLIPSVCSGFWHLGTGSAISGGMSMSRESLGDLVGERAGGTLPAMTVKMGNISWSEMSWCSSQ